MIGLPSSTSSRHCSAILLYPIQCSNSAKNKSSNNRGRDSGYRHRRVSSLLHLRTRSRFLNNFSMDSMDSRWKGKNFIAIASSNPMSQIVAQLQAFLMKLEAQAMLSGCVTILEATPALTDLLNRSCFGREISTCDKDKQWFQLSAEESFYLHYNLRSLTITTENKNPIDTLQLWKYFMLRMPTFPILYKAYAHLRAKNWVVRSGTQYGVDFVAYRHHPALVHSEFAVLVLSDGNTEEDAKNARLKVWSDLQCSLRVSGSVAKTLLVLNVNKNGSDVGLPLCLEHFSIEERTIKRWVPEQCREEEPRGNISPTNVLSEENNEKDDVDSSICFITNGFQ